MCPRVDARTSQYVLVFGRSQIIGCQLSHEHQHVVNIQVVIDIRKLSFGPRQLINLQLMICCRNPILFLSYVYFSVDVRLF